MLLRRWPISHTCFKRGKNAFCSPASVSLGFSTSALRTLTTLRNVPASGLQCRLMSSVKTESKNSEFELGDEACPQGIQGDDCDNFKLWLNNCRRYGLANCNDQLQGIQSGRKTMAEVMAEQEKLIAEIAAQYRSAHSHKESMDTTQGVQGGTYSAFPVVDSPCPQGIQGDDCVRFKLWLENCHRFGLHDCMDQLESFQSGRKSLAQIFSEQDKMIRDAAKALSQQRRSYSTSAGGSHQGTPNPDPSNPEGKGKEGELSQRQKLQRAVKEYGSTVIVFHVTISLMSLGFFFGLVSSGLDVAGFLMKLNIGGDILKSKLAAGTGTFVVAYAVHKVFAPVRIAITLTSTPFIVRYLRHIGFLKMPKPKS